MSDPDAARRRFDQLQRERERHGLYQLWPGIEASGSVDRCASCGGSIEPHVLTIGPMAGGMIGAGSYACFGCLGASVAAGVGVCAMLLRKPVGGYPSPSLFSCELN